MSGEQDAWVEVEHGDVQRTHPTVPNLPNGRYVHEARVTGWKRAAVADANAARFYREALQRIANADYRGNRSWESTEAYNALRRIGHTTDTNDDESASGAG